MYDIIIPIIIRLRYHYRTQYEYRTSIIIRVQPRKGTWANAMCQVPRHIQVVQIYAPFWENRFQRIEGTLLHN